MLRTFFQRGGTTGRFYSEHLYSIDCDASRILRKLREYAQAFNNTGDEYDIKEDYSVEPGVSGDGRRLEIKGFKYVKTVIVLSEEKKLELLRN